jgi:sugar lactone lactonase YvrE
MPANHLREQAPPPPVAPPECSDSSLPAAITCLWPAKAILGEGLAYDPATNVIWFVDIKNPRLFRYGLSDGSRKIWQLPAEVSALALPSGAWIPPFTVETTLLCVGKGGFAWLAIKEDKVLLHPIANPEPDRTRNRFNDGKLGPDECFYAGTMDDSEIEASGAFYVMDKDGFVTCLDDGYLVTNGPAFSPDGRTLYENDSARRRTYAFDLSKHGEVSGRRIFHAFSEEDGSPDGMTTDASGHLWIAMWDGGRIQRLGPTGARAGFIEIPVIRPTSCAFLSDGRLAFTSASLGLSDKSPLDGGLFVAELREVPK